MSTRPIPQLIMPSAAWRLPHLVVWRGLGAQGGCYSHNSSVSDLILAQWSNTHNDANCFTARPWHTTMRTVEAGSDGSNGQCENSTTRDEQRQTLSSPTFSSRQAPMPSANATMHRESDGAGMVFAGLGSGNGRSKHQLAIRELAKRELPFWHCTLQLQHHHLHRPRRLQLLPFLNAARNVEWPMARAVARQRTCSWLVRRSSNAPIFLLFQQLKSADVRVTF